MLAVLISACIIIAFDHLDPRTIAAASLLTLTAGTLLFESIYFWRRLP